jgi:futalosine hydrolase
VQQILIVSATLEEVAPFLNHFIHAFDPHETLFQFESKGVECTVLITGVGMVETAYALARLSYQSFDAIFNAGIAGSFNKHIAIGDCVLVMRDELAEMGAEDGDAFICYADMQLGGSNSFHAKYADQFHVLNGLTKVKGITVNTVHGNEASIAKAIALFKADTESMEGAAFYRAAIPMAPIVLQIRAISNAVEKRDRSKWQIPLAIQQLNKLLIQLLAEIT